MCVNGSIRQDTVEVKVCPDHRLADRLLTEIEDLIAEVFATTYGADWHDAIRIALDQFADLMQYADDWDFEVWVCRMELIQEAQEQASMEVDHEPR